MSKNLLEIFFHNHALIKGVKKFNGDDIAKRGEAKWKSVNSVTNDTQQKQKPNCKNLRTNDSKVIDNHHIKKWQKIGNIFNFDIRQIEHRKENGDDLQNKNIS